MPTRKEMKRASKLAKRILSKKHNRSSGPRMWRRNSPHDYPTLTTLEDIVWREVKHILNERSDKGSTRMQNIAYAHTMNLAIERLIREKIAKTLLLRLQAQEQRGATDDGIVPMSDAGIYSDEDGSDEDQSRDDDDIWDRVSDRYQDVYDRGDLYDEDEEPRGWTEEHGWDQGES